MDEEGVQAAAAGNRAAQDALLREYHDVIWRVCRRLAGNDADAADATQEALLAILRGLPRFDGRSSLKTWVYRVATNACLDEMRRRSRRAAPMDDEALRAKDSSGIADRTEELAQRAEIDAALRQLTPEFRVAVVLRDLCDLPYEEIGEILGVPVGTVRSRIARGRTALVSVLDGNLRPVGQRPTTEGTETS